MQMPHEQFQPMGLAEPPDESDEFDGQTELMLKQISALAADDKWDLIKRYMKARIELRKAELDSTVQAKVANDLIGEKFSIFSELEMEFNAFITWIETNAQEVKKREQRRKRTNKS